MASVLYTSNTTSQSVLADGLIDLGSTLRRTCGSQANLSGNGITLSCTGYFAVSVNATFTAPAAGNVTIALYKDGVLVPGAIATETITTADTEVRSISFTVEVRNTCCEQLSTLTVINDGVAATLSNISVRVKRDA